MSRNRRVSRARSIEGRRVAPIERVSIEPAARPINSDNFGEYFRCRFVAAIRATQRVEPFCLGARESVCARNFVGRCSVRSVSTIRAGRPSVAFRRGDLGDDRDRWRGSNEQIGHGALSFFVATSTDPA